MVNCRYQVTLKDAVDGALLQQALDAARAKAPYYFQKPVWEKSCSASNRRTPPARCGRQCKARISGRERLYCCPEL